LISSSRLFEHQRALSAGLTSHLGGALRGLRAAARLEARMQEDPRGPTANQPQERRGRSSIDAAHDRARRSLKPLVRSLSGLPVQRKGRARRTCSFFVTDATPKASRQSEPDIMAKGGLVDGGKGPRQLHSLTPKARPASNRLIYLSSNMLKNDLCRRITLPGRW